MDGWDALHGVDGPLLVALQQLLTHQSVSEAARRVGTSQPSMSRTLARLRALFGDPLLRPVGRRLELTAQGQQLQPRVARALESLRQLLVPGSAQLPGPAPRHVRVAASDYAVAVVLEMWVARLQTEAPGTRVHVEPLGLDTVGRLARGELEAAIAPRVLVEGTEPFVYRPLLQDRLVWVMRRQHPRAQRPATLREYLRLEHVRVSTGRPEASTVDVQLHRQGQARTVVASVPTFLGALRWVEHSDLAAALPERLVLPHRDGLRLRALPFAVPALSLQLVWHSRHTTDEAHRGMRQGILDAVASAPPKPRSARPRNEKS